MALDTRSIADQAPVLVIGAGPVGLTMAAELARYQVPVRIIDKSPRATQTSKALVVWGRTLELLERAGCAQAFVDAGVAGKGVVFRSGGKVLAEAGFADVSSPYNFACMIPQRDTERLLTAHLRSFGIEIEREVRLAQFEEGTGGVSCRLEHADGTGEEMETPWLIGCDGAHSTVRHSLGLAFEGYEQDDNWILADVRLQGDQAPPGDRLTVFFHKDGPFVSFPMPGGRMRIIGTTGKADPDSPPPDPTLAEVQALADERTGGGFQVLDPVWLSNFRINERKVNDYGRGRAFLAGDAAHVHSPAGGQGMNTGIQDAINLAWKLAMVIRGDAPRTVLGSYSVERSAVGDMVLRNAGLLTEMGTLANPAVQAIRNMALHLMLGLQFVQHRMAATMSETDISYPKSPLSVGERAGERVAPDAYAGPPPGSGTVPRFVLYADDFDQARRLAARYPTLLDPAPRRSSGNAELLIVRPDGYIGFGGERDDWASADRYLRALAPG